MTRTLVRQRGARALSGREMRVCVDAGTRWAWQLEDSLAAVYDEQIRAMYDQAAKLLARLARPVTAASPPSGWTIPDPDELGLSLREQMDDRHKRRQAGDDASEAIRVEAVRRVTDAGLQAMGISLSTRNPLVEGVLRDQLGGKIVGIRETTRRDVMGSLETSWKAGDSIPRAAAALRAAAPGIAASRSRTIARTEMLAAVNGGAHALASISNAAGAADGQPPLLKIWLTAQDERVRDSHMDAGDAYGAGSGIPIDEPFEVGDSRLQFPGDPDGSAGEVINCRCAISYEEASDPAPAETGDVVAESIDDPSRFDVSDLARALENVGLERRAAEAAPDLDPLEALRSTSTEDLLAQIAREQSGRPAEALPEPSVPDRAAETPAEMQARMDREGAEEAALQRALQDSAAELHAERRAAANAATPEGSRVLVDSAGEHWSADQLRGMFDTPAVERLGLDVQASSVDEGVDQAVVYAFVGTESGEPVAEIQRSIDLRARTVHHDSFFIEPAWQGKGLAKDFLRSSVLEYDMAGIERVTVNAAGVNGRYTWARFGFDFQHPDEAEGMRKTFLRAFFQNARSTLSSVEGKSDAEITAALREKYPQTFARIEEAQHSWEFAGMSIDEAGLSVPDFGKRAMISGHSWSGVLDLDPASASRKVFDDYTA